MISLLGFFLLVSFGTLVFNASENGAEAVLLALSVFSIVFQDCTRWTNVYTYWCVCFVTCPTYEGGGTSTQRTTCE